MFKVNEKKLNLKKVTSRGIGYGHNDLGDREQSYSWNENIINFLEKCEKKINNFIDECRVDDINQDEPDIDYLFKLDYPHADFLIQHYPNLFCDLILRFSSLLVFDAYLNLYEELLTGFAINSVNNVFLKDHEIIIEGNGYYFGQ